MDLTKLINLEDIKEELRLIEGSNTDYITPTGKIYSHKEKYDQYYLKSNYINNHNGYTYCGINFNGVSKNRRVHVLVAKAYIPNPNNYKIVGHKHNNKSCTDVNELYWTTNQENVNRAISDGLLKNKDGIDNENSQPIKVVDLKNNLVSAYGSISEVERYVENCTRAYVAKMCKRKGNYKPRGKKYKYIPISFEEFNSIDNNIKYKYLRENIPGNKNPKKFKATNIITREEVISDNQTKFAKDHNLIQALISHAILNNSIYDDWQFELIEELSYKESTLYNNFIDTINSYKLTNIKTNEEHIFNSGKELKDYLGFTGHDLSAYINKNNILMDKYKLCVLD